MTQQRRINVAVVALVAVFVCCSAGAHAGPLESLVDGFRWATRTGTAQDETAQGRPGRELQQADDNEVFIRRVFSFRTLVRSGLKIDGLEPVGEDQRSSATASVREQTQNSILGLLVRVAPETYPSLAGLKPSLVEVKEDGLTRSGLVPAWAEELETRYNQTWNTTDCETASPESQDWVESTYKVESTNTTFRHALELYKITMGDLTTQVMQLTDDICGIVSLGFTWVDEYGIPEMI